LLYKVQLAVDAINILSDLTAVVSSNSIPPTAPSRIFGRVLTRGSPAALPQAGRSVLLNCRWHTTVVGRTNPSFRHAQRGADPVTVPGNIGVAEHLDTDEWEEQVANGHQRLERRQPPQESIHSKGALDNLAFRGD
jgi:hypothetical protein